MIGPIPESPPTTAPGPNRLRDLCSEFEATFAATLLKEALKPMGSDIEDSAGGNFLTMAREQFALELGKQGLLGIGDRLYEQLQALYPEAK